METPKSVPEIDNRILEIKEILKTKNLRKFHKGRYEDLLKQYGKLKGAISMLPMINQEKIREHAKEIEFNIQTIEQREKEEKLKLEKKLREQTGRTGILAYID